MKKLSIKRVFILIMFLWIVNVGCVVWLSTAVQPLFTLLFGAGDTFVCGFIVWDMLKRIK